MTFIPAPITLSEPIAFPQGDMTPIAYQIAQTGQEEVHVQDSWQKQIDGLLSLSFVYRP